MKISTIKEAQTLTISVTGSINTVTAPELEKKLREDWNGISVLIFDFADVEYISSAGLRVVMVADRHMTADGKLILKNVNGDVMEIFEMTGFVELLNFE